MPPELHSNTHDEVMELFIRCREEKSVPPTAKTTTLILQQDNYTDWSIFVEGALKSKGWDQFLQSPWHDGQDGTTHIYLAVDPGSLSTEKTNEAASRLECSNYIVNQVNRLYWGIFDTSQGDPYLLWKDIKEVWMSKDFQDRIIRRWYLLELEGMKLKDQSIFMYIGRAREMHAKFTEMGGSMSTLELIACIVNGLPLPEYQDVKEKFHAHCLAMQGIEPVGDKKLMQEQLWGLQEWLENIDEKLSRRPAE